MVIVFYQCLVKGDSIGDVMVTTFMIQVQRCSLLKFAVLCFMSVTFPENSFKKSESINIFSSNMKMLGLYSISMSLQRVSL